MVYLRQVALNVLEGKYANLNLVLAQETYISARDTDVGSTIASE